MLGKSVKLLRAEGRWTTLVTWADEGEGHQGGIYRASNWEYLGPTKPSFRYRERHSGKLVSRKVGAQTIPRREMIEMGYIEEGPFRKHKFRLVL